MTKFKQIFFLFIFFFLPFTTWADQLIIEPDMGRAPILDAIQSTQHSLNLVMYGLTDDQLLNSLIQQKEKGRTIKIILEQHPYKTEGENDRSISAFDKNGLSWQGSIPPFRLIHQKTLLIDGKKAIVMTFNFTHSTFKSERNFALILDDKRKVNAINSVFSADWNHQPITTHAPDLIFSPDNSREKLLAEISQAKHSLNIYAQGVSDFKIIGAFANAAKKGVKVNILTSSKIRDKQAEYLARAGVHLRYSKHYYIHAKVLIIDNQKAVIGSINFTRASLDNNRELAVETQDIDIVKKLTATFDHDWNGAENTNIKNMNIKNVNIKNFLPSKSTIIHTFRLIKKYMHAHS